MATKIKNFVLTVAILGLLFCSYGTQSAQAGVPESKEPIKIVMMGYSGDNIIMYIYGELIKKLGYNIEYTPADYIGQFTGVGAGGIHLCGTHCAMVCR